MSGNFERMKAVRLFAAELKATTVDIPKKGGDQYESQFYLTQTGAKAARVMVVGTATEIEDIGTDNNFYRMRVSDPTGVHFVTAGQYQPEAARVMQELIKKLPAFVAVIGKVSLYNNGENTTLVSIRAEQVSIVDENIRDTWLLETAKATLDRLSALKDNPVLEQEVAAAYPTGENYKEIVRKVITEMKSTPVGGASQSGAIQAPAAAVTATATATTMAAVTATAAKATEALAPGTPPVQKQAAPADPSEEDLKKFIEQKLISMNNGGKGVKIGHLAQQGKGAGISSIKLEELIDALKHEGRIYEPRNGVLMPTEGGK
jgi:RPA family protein